jgi:cytochrome c oxidase subunit 2
MNFKSVLLLPLYHIAFLDAASSWQLNFQDPATPNMQGLIDLHHDIFSIMLFVLLFVVCLISTSLFLFLNTIRPVKLIHGSLIELLWTVSPSVILIFIALPSFALLYVTDQLIEPSVTVKAVGHQWYWNYQYSDYSNYNNLNLISFDSYMLQEIDLQLGQLRLLEVDNRLVLPVKNNIRVIITSADVLHSWAIPSMGVKCDAVPGRLNQVATYLKREGVYYGQCSELCGVNHGFMPIAVEAVSKENYLLWAVNKME